MKTENEFRLELINPRELSRLVCFTKTFAYNTFRNYDFTPPLSANSFFFLSRNPMFSDRNIYNKQRMSIGANFRQYNHERI